MKQKIIWQLHVYKKKSSNQTEISDTAEGTNPVNIKNELPLQ